MYTPKIHRFFTDWRKKKQQTVKRIRYTRCDRIDIIRLIFPYTAQSLLILLKKNTRPGYFTPQTCLIIIHGNPFFVNIHFQQFFRYFFVTLKQLRILIFTKFTIRFMILKTRCNFHGFYTKVFCDKLTNGALCAILNTK